MASYPQMPDVPTVVDDEDEPVKTVLRQWCFAYAREYAAMAVAAERERIALTWDGCVHEGSPCDMDIGASIRAGSMVPWSTNF